MTKSPKKPLTIKTAAHASGLARVPCGNRTHLASLEGWHLCRSAKGTFIDQLRRQESNLRQGG